MFLEALAARIQGQRLQRTLLKYPFLLRTAQPPLEECACRVLELRCQTGGTLLAARSLSRLLKQDWPRSIDALENGRPKDVGKL